MITARTGSASRANRSVTRGVAGYISVWQDTGDGCPTCLFIRVRADRADQLGMIALSVDEVAELRAVMRGKRR